MLHKMNHLEKVILNLKIFDYLIEQSIAGTILFVLIIATILPYFLNKLNMAKELNEQFASLIKIYLVVYKVDIIKNTSKKFNRQMQRYTRSSPTSKAAF